MIIQSCQKQIIHCVNKFYWKLWSDFKNKSESWTPVRIIWFSLLEIGKTVCCSIQANKIVENRNHIKNVFPVKL